MKKTIDFAIIGGGLAGCLTFLALKHKLPGLRVHLFEAEGTVCGNHTWSFHETDIKAANKSGELEAWLRPCISRTWREQEVHFPEYSRVLSNPYHSIFSHDLAAKVTAMGRESIHTHHRLTRIQKTEQDLYQLHFADAPPVQTHSYLLARGWQELPADLPVGWQKFVGLEVQLHNPHGLQRVILKDACQPQIDGYRFFYTLPLSEKTLLIEDTYYSNHALLKTERIEKEIHAYAERKGWQIESVLRRETGALPLYLKIPPAREATLENQGPSLGAESVLVHPVTGYTTPYTLRAIDKIVCDSSLTVPAMKRALTQMQKNESRRLYYFTILNRMLFLAAKNETRYKVLEKFYRFPEPIIDRFYSGEVTVMDRLRILTGKPPVPVFDALQAIQGKRPLS